MSILDSVKEGLHPAGSTLKAASQVEQNSKHGIGRVYVINLDRRPERMSYMALQLNALGLHYMRFEAVDGPHLLSKIKGAVPQMHQNVRWPMRWDISSPQYKAHWGDSGALGVLAEPPEPGPFPH